MNPKKPRLERGSLLALLDEAVLVARSFFGRLYLGLALPPALAAGLMAASQGLMMPGMLSATTAPGPEAMLSMLRHFGLFFLFFFIYMALMALSAAAIFAGAAASLQGRSISALEAWRWAIRGRNLWTLTLMGVLTGLGALFCLLPGIYLMIVWALTLPVMLWEDGAGFEALERSRKLVGYGPDRPVFSPGMGWVLLVGVTVVVLNYGVSMAVQMPLTIVQQLFMLRHVMGQEASQAAVNPMSVFPPWFFALQALSTMLTTMVQMLVMFFSASAFNLLYLRLRGRKEGGDLMEALNRLRAPE